MTTREEQKRKMAFMQQGMRLMNAGLSRDFGTPPRRGWIAGGNDLRQAIKPDKLLEACERFRDALAIGPDMTALNLLGLMLESLGKYGEAEKAFRDLAWLSGEQQSKPYADGARTGAARCARKATDPSWAIRLDGVPPAVSTAGMEAAEKCAADFGAALVTGRFADAHKMLSRAAKKRWSAQQIEQGYKSITEHLESQPELAGVLEVLQEWPAKSAGDVAWIYISLDAEDGGEAVSVVVQSEGDRHAIREIEWGRP
jgi:hypothetical protein